MTDVWDDLRRRWQDAYEAVENGDDEDDEGVRLTPTGLGASVNPIAVLGEPGAGKTVLYKSLSLAYRGGASDSTISPRPEKHQSLLRIDGAKQLRLSVVVIPGQASHEREQAMRETMLGDASPRGIIYVTCWGHNRIWHRGVQQEVQETLEYEHGTVTAEDLREWHLEKERADFRELVYRIIDKEVAKRLEWLAVVVSKADLYWDRLDEARDYYIPGGPGGPGAESRFCRLMRDLEKETRLRIAVVPMSSRLIRYKPLPGLGAQRSLLDDPQLGPLRRNLGRTVQELLLPERNGAGRGRR
ncbi:hypothetical protein ACIPYS_24975 [Kitasatospora sp. NPDC089913]|uniref:hypothetical protein n=1 Tax=Kitasatospora sp. NPDC089913 TaxID=3364080 RepID=UPI0038097A21